MQNEKVLTDLLTSIIGPNRPADQIYLYSTDMGSFGTGLDNSSTKDRVSETDWYKALIDSPSGKIIFCNKDDRLSKYFTYKEGAYFMTFCTTYRQALYQNPQGIIEVKRSAASLFAELERLITTGYEENIYIYNAVGEPIYPIESGKSYKHFEAFLDPESNEKIDDDVFTFNIDKNTHVFYTTSDYSGCTTIITIDNKSLMKPIYDFTKTNIAIFVFFILLAIALSVLVSKIITDPLMKMYSQVRTYDMTDAGSQEGEFSMVDTNLIELDTLFNALVDMQKRNKESMEREIALHNQEMQSRMLALQSQMNPHFLYNSLATLQSMADEGMNEEIVNMCQTISRILRYISSDKELLVPISEDLSHVKDYLSCMKIRYADDLEYEISIPDEMSNLLIPKLCMQLIVENSIKYATKSVRPPWHIQITGTITNTYWEIAITDNGTGFGEDELASINEKIAYINETSLLPSLEIKGMGLLNIYMRFKTLYKGRHIFKIGNLASGGAIVTIGGDLNIKEDEHE